MFMKKKKNKLLSERAKKQWQKMRPKMIESMQGKNSELRKITAAKNARKGAKKVSIAQKKNWDSGKRSKEETRRFKKEWWANMTPEEKKQIRKNMSKNYVYHAWNKGKKGIQVAWNKGLTKENSESIRKYAKSNSKTRKRLILEGKIRHPNLNMTNVSKGQKVLFLLLSAKYPDAILEHPIRTKKSIRYVDVAIPSLKIVAEYDGKHWHKDKIEADVQRDRELAEVGWHTIRYDEANFDKILGSIL